MLPPKKKRRIFCFMKITYSRATVGMAKMQSRHGNQDIFGTLTIENNGICLKISDFSDIGKAFGITTHKLLCAGLMWFTKKNNIGDDRDNIRNEIAIPLRKYALLCGHSGIEAKDENDQKRANESLNTVRKQVSKDLKLLLRCSLQWQESTRGKKEDYECPILTAGRIRNGYVYMTFSQEFAKYLKHRRIAEYPEKLFSVDNRKPNAYRIGQALAFHYYNTNNKNAGNFNKMRVSTLLAYTNLPTIQAVRQSDSGTWRNRIKEPFETALNELVAKGIISKWECKPKTNSLLSDGNHKMTYEEWADSLIYFTCINDTLPQSNADSVHPESPAQFTESPSEDVQTAEQAQQPQDTKKHSESSQPSKDKPKSGKTKHFYRKQKLKLALSKRRKE